jgi:hypothetical protein
MPVVITAALLTTTPKHGKRNIRSSVQAMLTLKHRGRRQKTQNGERSGEHARILRGRFEDVEHRQIGRASHRPCHFNPERLFRDLRVAPELR